MLSNKFDNSKYMQILNFLDNEFKSDSSSQIDKYIEKLEFETNKDLRDAIVGNRLYPYNVKSCPELPAVNKIKEKLEEQIIVLFQVKQLWKINNCLSSWL